jgi:pyruvate/2-oxoglutarate dehydrogenase complex dihydrolipoamide acyltransferase (E2) component
MFDVIERLKAEWTDKYVVIDSPAPELARFARATGQVKTVNMNGRCLVEFDQFNNIGWYDVDPACLKVVPKPLPKPAEPKEKPAKPAAKAAPAKEAAKPAAAKKPSTADILAAARGKAAAAPAAGSAKPSAGAKPSTAEILARARGAKAAPPTVAEPEESAAAEATPAEAPAPAKPAAKKAAGGSLPTTTADKIAWCRTHDAKG